MINIHPFAERLMAKPYKRYRSSALSMPFRERCAVADTAAAARTLAVSDRIALQLLLSPITPNTMQDQQGKDGMGVGSMIREVQELAEKFKVEEDDQYISPYAQLEKATVLQEARYVWRVGGQLIRGIPDTFDVANL
jgi:hypothetical protein